MTESDFLWTNPDSGRISDDQRNVLKNKSGFGGYTAYLEDYNEKNPGSEPLLKAWRELRTLSELYHPCRNECEILDLTKDENSLISLNICCQTASNSELFTALSEPRKGVYGRIVIWRMAKSHMNDTDFLEDLGLVLNIGPTFVKSLYTKSAPHFLGFTHIPVFGGSHLMVGDRVATMTRCCISEKSSAVPIALIAEAIDSTLGPRGVDPIFQQPNSARRSGTSEYGNMIMSIIEQNSVFSGSADALIMPALLAATHMDADSLRDSCDYRFPNGTNHGNGNSLEPTSTDSNELRRRIEDFEDVTQDALTGLVSLYGGDWSREYEFESTVEYIKQSINRARRFEAYNRDRCQILIGQHSYEESRKSIQLSISQIEEGKRIKIFTVFAFIYVPLNLASSIFGMNIQQLNNSGQSMKTFLVTTVVILVLTGVSWLCTHEVNQYRSWSRRPKPPLLGKYLPRPTYSIAVRVRMLVWLICNGHWTWARKTKAWWYILANSRADHWHGFIRRLPTWVDPTDGFLSAGDYVSKYICSRDASDAFSLNLGEESEGEGSLRRVSS